MDISIIIVNYKCKGQTLSCIKSINEADFGGLRYEIIVVDNNSEDGIGYILKWQYPEVVFIQTGKNSGMGGGNNYGIKKAAGEFVAVMNPDIIAFKDAFSKLYAFMRNRPDVGIAGPKQYNPDRSLQDSCYRWHSFLTPVFRRTPLGLLSFGRRDIDKFLMKDFDHNSIKEVDWLLGSFLFIRKKALDEAGGFDDKNFFLYFEDTDLCRRFWQKNWRVVYFPDAEVIHNHSRKSAEDPWYKFFTNPAARAHIASWVRYLIKWR